MNEKVNSTGLILYRVGYQWPGANGNLRSGTLVVEAKDAASVQKIADEKLASFGLKNYRITSQKVY